MNYSPGDRVRGAFIIRELEHKETVHGTPYTVFRAVNPDQSLRCRSGWGFSLPFENGDVVELSLVVEEYKGQLNYIVETIERSTTDPIGLLPGLSREEEGRYWGLLVDFAHLIINDGLREMVLDALESTANSFVIAPASKVYHHAYRGGLLVHTYEVAQIAHDIASFFTDGRAMPPNRDVVLAGALLHDIGKAWAYDLLSGETTDSEALVGHIIYGIRYFDSPDIDGFDEAPQGLIEQVAHCIAAHHGSLEWGSPVTPKTQEAFIVHYADMLSSRLAMIHEAAPGKNGWTEFVKPLGTSIYIGE